MTVLLAFLTFSVALLTSYTLWLGVRAIYEEERRLSIPVILVAVIAVSGSAACLWMAGMVTYVEGSRHLGGP